MGKQSISTSCTHNPPFQVRPGPPDDSPQTPDLSSWGPSAMASPTSPPTHGPGTTHTLSTLAHLPVSEIMKLANSSSVTGLPLAKADPCIIDATNQFLDGLQGKPAQQQN